MRRKLFTLASALSLVLFIGTIAVWLLSYRADEFLTYESRTRAIRWELHAIVGRGEFQWYGESRPFEVHGFGLRAHWWRIDYPKWKYEFGDDEAHGQWGFLFARGIEEHVPYDYKLPATIPAAAEDATPIAMINVPYWTLVVPLWSIATSFALLPCGIVLGVMRRKLRRAHGCCPSCGYNIRATPDRCPECGTVPTKLKSQRETTISLTDPAPGPSDSSAPTAPPSQRRGSGRPPRGHSAAGGA